MQPDLLRRLFMEIRDGRLSAEEAMARMQCLPFEDLDDLKLDHHRSLRTGFPETIFGSGKNLDQIRRAITGLAAGGGPVLVTRLDPELVEPLRVQFPNGTWHEAAGIFEIASSAAPPTHGRVAVVAAGTSDLAVAEEAAVTARAFGAEVETIYDVGVAGIHRLLEHRERLRAARVVIVVAGMEGALASVVGGLLDAVVIAVPTSVGYGASFGGLAALLAMLNSCAAGVLVTNIDNGHGAGLAAVRICRWGTSDKELA